MNRTIQEATVKRYHCDSHDQRRLEAPIRDRTAAQKHVLRAKIVLLSAAAAIGTVDIMRRTGKSKTWRLAMAGTL